jgi:TusA-related sulfurtransferase
MTLETGHVHIPPAHAMLDAGEADTALLLSAIARRIGELAAGQVLEVASRAPDAKLNAVAWCQETSHELLALLTAGPVTRIWIRKRIPAE